MFWIFQSWEETCELPCRRPRSDATFEVAPTLCCATFDVKLYLARNGRPSGDDHDAHVESGVRLLGVVDVEGEVGRGHGHAEAHSLGKLVLSVPDLTGAEVDHLNTQKSLKPQRIQENKTRRLTI